MRIMPSSKLSENSIASDSLRRLGCWPRKVPGQMPTVAPSTGAYDYHSISVRRDVLSVLGYCCRKVWWRAVKRWYCQRQGGKRSATPGGWAHQKKKRERHCSRRGRESNLFVSRIVTQPRSARQIASICKHEAHAPLVRNEGGRPLRDMRIQQRIQRDRAASEMCRDTATMEQDCFRMRANCVKLMRL